MLCCPSCYACRGARSSLSLLPVHDVFWALPVLCELLLSCCLIMLMIESLIDVAGLWPMLIYVELLCCCVVVMAAVNSC